MLNLNRLTKFTLLFAISALFLMACSGTQKGAENGYFGEKFKVKNAIGLNALAGQMASSDSLNVQVKGVVESVCQKKGCWMNITTDEGKELFVQFKDYGFFMPLDLMGNEVILNGHAYKDVTPVDELRHYAEDEGLSPEEIAKITEPKEELKFLATGVYAAAYIN